MSLSSPPALSYRLLGFHTHHKPPAQPPARARGAPTHHPWDGGAANALVSTGDGRGLQSIPRINVLSAQRAQSCKVPAKGLGLNSSPTPQKPSTAHPWTPQNPQGGRAFPPATDAGPALSGASFAPAIKPPLLECTPFTASVRQCTGNAPSSIQIASHPSQPPRATVLGGNAPPGLAERISGCPRDCPCSPSAGDTEPALFEGAGSRCSAKPCVKPFKPHKLCLGYLLNP